jgi:hypothetical protein
VIAALPASEHAEAATELGVRLMRRWAEIDPRAAAAAIGPMPQRGCAWKSLDQVAVAWANRQASDAANPPHDRFRTNAEWRRGDGL